MGMKMVGERNHCDKDGNNESEVGGSYYGDNDGNDRDSEKENCGGS